MRPANLPFAGRSLRARLLASAAIFIVLAIVAIGFVMNDLLDRFVRADVANRLDLRIARLVGDAPAPPRQRDADAGPPRRPGAEGPPDEREASGWYWQIEEDGRVVATSPNLGNEVLPRLSPDAGRRGPPDRLIDLVGPKEQRLVVRTRALPGPSARLVVATAPATAIEAPLRDAALTIALTLGLLGVGLGAAIALQVRFALSPLDRLRGTLAEVRAGRRERIDEPQPVELQALTDELNALIAHDAEVLRQARRHVANLGHGLKTPLATLSAQAARLPDGPMKREWQSLTELMDRRIRHHLRRARSVAQGGPARQRTVVKPHVDDLAAMLEKFGAGSRLTISRAIPDGLAVAVDGDDLDEMLGNLLDNGCRHAKTTIEVVASRSERFVRITIADDGPGLGPEEIDRVLKPGARLDETLPGHGFGLPITSEIAELYGGSLRLRRNDTGGLLAELMLPAPPDL
ncbi:sensor histidine kinase [Aureimonas jatrophae]|uniref:histidine kinase n=1 Tax=Aureimonas jatrophae TaxID=1166073 RepID=A0A1H0GJV6_9HYPH|nr:HAMP domain-containing sensor histidine kinase [Aureimonas jatrophae]MBB3949604.1 signal transduction histidine kinase [Aureimonas jatrophae]SDO07110.1 Signal transduction histidine kinase [Aureimonas jatrophae]